MKVCHMTSVHPSTDGRIFYKECSSLAKFGHDVTLVACGHSREENGVRVIGVGPVPKSRIKRILHFSKTVYKAALKTDADVYHLHDPELLRYVKKLKRKGKKVIFDSHENTLEQMYEKKWIPKLFRNLFGTLYRRYATKILKKTDAVISVTPHIVDMLRAINPKTFMITNYPILQDRADTRAEANDVLTLCFTGGISSDWGHELIVECLDRLENCRYVLCGKTEEAYLNRLKAMAGWSKVSYLGQIPNSKALEIQRNSDIGMALLVPSKNTNGMQGTIGNTKIFEYMMAGIPIICTEFSLWKDIVDKYRCGICVDINDTRSIENAIEFIRSDPEKAAQMGNNGRRATEEHYNWASQEKILSELYSSLEANI